MQDFTLESFFSATDSMNSSSFISHFATDAQWYFGNNEPLVGKEQIKEMAEQFFTTLKGIKHDISKSVRSTNDIFFEGNVRYFRHDGNVVKVPFACSIALNKELVQTYRTYIDLAPLLAFETRI